MPTDVRIRCASRRTAQLEAIARNFGPIDAARVFRTMPTRPSQQKITYQRRARDIDRHNVPDSILSSRCSRPNPADGHPAHFTASVEVISTAIAAQPGLTAMRPGRRGARDRSVDP